MNGATGRNGSLRSFQPGGRLAGGFLNGAVNHFHQEGANHSNQSMTTKVLFVGYNIQNINKLKSPDKRLKYHGRYSKISYTTFKLLGHVN